nr:PEP-CTERM sorting domain-containing protein [uncultured Rhodoferax sp.]
MKFIAKAAAAVALLAGLASPAAMAAASATLTFSGGTTTSLSHVYGDFDPVLLAGDYSAYNLQSMQKGATLFLSSVANLTYTFLGEEAAFNNAFGAYTISPLAAGALTNNGSPMGTSFSLASVAGGALKFAFNSNLGWNLFANGSKSIGVVMANDSKSALLLFNDKGHDGDFDDMVIKVAITTPVPEPETYAMLIAGLAVLGAAARRRKSRA